MNRTRTVMLGPSDRELIRLAIRKMSDMPSTNATDANRATVLAGLLEDADIDIHKTETRGVRPVG